MESPSRIAWRSRASATSRSRAKDFEIARHIVPSLTTVAAPNREIGTRAGGLLLKSISNPSTLPEEIDLCFSVVARESASRTAESPKEDT